MLFSRSHRSVSHQRVADPLIKSCSENPPTLFTIFFGDYRFLKKSTLKWCGDRPHGGSKGQVPASATLYLQTDLKNTSTSSLLQALVCGSRDLSLTTAVRSIPAPFQWQIVKRVGGSAEQDLLRNSATRSALPIPAPLVGEGIPSPNSQFWCGESLPLPNFLKLPLVQGGQPKLVRGARTNSTNSARRQRGHLRHIEMSNESNNYETATVFSPSGARSRPMPDAGPLPLPLPLPTMVWQRLSHLMVPLTCAYTEP